MQTRTTITPASFLEPSLDGQRRAPMKTWGITHFSKEIVMMEPSNYPGSTEDRVTKNIEQQTSRIPSTTFLGLALGSMGVSAVLKILGHNHWALFVGQWAAPLLIMGNYNKMVKQHGSDARSRFETAA